MKSFTLRYENYKKQAFISITISDFYRHIPRDGTASHAMNTKHYHTARVN